MDNNEEKLQDLDLEDILKEFGDFSDPEEAPDPEIGELVTIFQSDEVTEAAGQPPLRGDTIRLDRIADVAVPKAEGTPVETADREVTPAEDFPDEDPTDAPEIPEVETTLTEDYLDEDVTDAPAISDDTIAVPSPGEPPAPPKPIVFDPRAKLRELKRKLVAGPEKRYYELSEIGVGKLQLGMFVCFVIVLLCAGATAMHAAGLIPENRMRLLIFSQVLAMGVSALLSAYCLMDGIADIFKGRFTLNTMLFFTLVACVVDAVFCLTELRVPCCAAFSLEAIFALWQRYERRNTEIGMLDTMRKASRLSGVVKVPDFYNGRPGLLRGEGKVEDFMDNYTRTTGPEKVQMIYTFLSFLLCIGIAVFAGLRHNVSMAFQILATSLLVATPASFFVSLTRPMAVLERRLHMVGTVLCGWQGVKKLCGKAAIPLSDADLFPAGSNKLNGVKFYGDRNPDQVVAYATALIKESGGGLEPIFTQLLKSRSGAEYRAENVRGYPGGGIGGEVWGESILMGSTAFLENMGVEIPEGTMVSQAVYCAIDGQLSAVFAISYPRMKSSAAGLVTLCAHRKLTPVLTSGDFMLTDVFLKSKFGVNTKRMAFPPIEERAALAARQPEETDTALAMTTQDGLSSMAYAVTGARALRSASRLGLTIHILGGVLGMLIMLALAYLGSTQLLTPVNVLLYQLVWAVPGLLITEWTRTV